MNEELEVLNEGDAGSENGGFEVKDIDLRPFGLPEGS